MIPFDQMKESGAFGDLTYGMTPVSMEFSPESSATSQKSPEQSNRTSQNTFKENNSFSQKKADETKGKDEQVKPKPFFSWSDEDIKKGLAGLKFCKPRKALKPVAKVPASSSVKKIGRFKVTEL